MGFCTQIACMLRKFNKLRAVLSLLKEYDENDQKTLEKSFFTSIVTQIKLFREKSNWN